MSCGRLPSGEIVSISTGYVQKALFFDSGRSQVLCTDTDVSANYIPSGRRGVISAQCVSERDGYLTTIIIRDINNNAWYTISLDIPVEVNVGDNLSVVLVLNYA